MIVTNLIIASYCSSLYHEIAYRRNPTLGESIQCEAQFSYLSARETQRQQGYVADRLGRDAVN